MTTDLKLDHTPPRPTDKRSRRKEGLVQGLGSLVPSVTPPSSLPPTIPSPIPVQTLGSPGQCPKRRVLGVVGYVLVGFLFDSTTSVAELLFQAASSFRGP